MHQMRGRQLIASRARLVAGGRGLAAAGPRPLSSRWRKTAESAEATRYATGRRNVLRIELNGERGSLFFGLERLNELWFHDATDPGFRRILVTEPDHPYIDAWWPPGHGLGYEHTFVHQVRDLVHAIDDGRRPDPSFADGLQVQRVLAAVEESAGKNSAHTPVTD